MNLRGGEPHAARILHRLAQIGDEALDLGRGGIRHRLGAAEENGMAHAGDLQKGHDPPRLAEKGLGGSPKPWYRASAMALPPHPARGGGGVSFRLRAGTTIVEKGEHTPVQVIVRDNNIDQALKALKKKLQREGVFREMKLRRHYEKPSERRAREAAEAIRRARKMERKRLEREGF